MRLVTRLALLASCALPFFLPTPAFRDRAPNVRPAARTRTTAFINVSVVPMDEQRILPHQTVIVKDGYIAQIGPADRIHVPAEAQRIDGRGKYLLPGLTDAHMHIRNVGDFLLYLANGVTTVRNMSGYAYHLRWRDRIANGQLLGPRLYTASNLVDGDPPFREGSLVVRTAEGAERVVTAVQREGYDFVKVYVKLDKTAYDGIIEAARRHHIRVVGHVPWAVGMTHVLDCKQASIEHAENIFQTWFESKIEPAGVPAMAKSVHDAGVAVCPTLTVFKSVLLNVESGPRLPELMKNPELRYIEPSVRDAWKNEASRFLQDEPNRLRLVDRFQEQLGFFKQITKGLHDARVTIIAGTDSPSSFRLPGQQLLEELQIYCNIGFTPYEALRAATHDSALFLDGTDTFGTVAVGKRADLLLVYGDPLQDIGNLAHRAGVMVQGRWRPQSEWQSALKRLAEIYARSSWRGGGYPEGGYEKLQAEIEGMLETMAAE